MSYHVMAKKSMYIVYIDFPIKDLDIMKLLGFFVGSQESEPLLTPLGG